MQKKNAILWYLYSSVSKAFYVCLCMYGMFFFLFKKKVAGVVLACKKKK